MNANLSIALSAAVPLWIERYKAMSYEDVMAELAVLSKDSKLHEKGDVLLFGSAKEGEAAQLFNDMAKSIACMSFLPGGITTFGQHYESKHDES